MGRLPHPIICLRVQKKRELATALTVQAGVVQVQALQGRQVTQLGRNRAFVEGRHARAQTNGRRKLEG